MLVSLAASAAANELLVQEFWAELHPLVTGTPTGTMTREQVITHLLQEARFVFSGMIYGFEFSYTPYDSAREVPDQFELTPIAEIPWGDPNLKVLDTRVENDLLHVRITYSPAEYQSQRYHAWSSNILDSATGQGTASYYDGIDSRMSAMKDAIKSAIRDYARARVYNKPKQITGTLSLVGAPRIIVDSGKYIATANIHLQISRIVPYTVF